MTYLEAIGELKVECQENDKRCGCKGRDCNDCYVQVAIKAIKKVLAMKGRDNERG